MWIMLNSCVARHTVDIIDFLPTGQCSVIPLGSVTPDRRKTQVAGFALSETVRKTVYIRTVPNCQQKIVGNNNAEWFNLGYAWPIRRYEERVLNFQWDYFDSWIDEVKANFKNMPLKLFYNEMSPPCRAVLMTAKVLGVDLEMTKVNIYTNEQIDDNLMRVSNSLILLKKVFEMYYQRSPKINSNLWFINE